MPNWRLDAHGLSPEATVFAERQLEAIRTEVLMKKFPDTSADEWIPQNTEYASHKRFVVHKMKEMLGLAAPISDATEDPPMANVSISETQYKVRNYGIGYRHTVDEIEAARAEGVPLDQDRAEAARLGTERRLNQVQWFGDTGNNLPGAINNKNVPRVQLASTIDSDTNPDTILDILNDLVNDTFKEARQTGRPNVMLLSTSAYSHIASTVRDPSSGTDTTIRDFLLDSNPYLDTVETIPELDGAGPNGEDLVFVFSDQGVDTMEHAFVKEFTQLAPQDDNYAIKTLAHAKTGGVPYNYPLEAVVGEIPLS